MTFANFDNDTFLEAASIKPDNALFERELIEGFTIDAPHSKDLDDGISLKRMGQNFILQVSIADVAALIPLDSRVYFEAKKRVHTLYLSAFNIPMMPQSLSEHKLSLLENEIRPTVTFEVELSPVAQILSVDIKHTSFKNIRRYSFLEIDQIVTQKIEDEHFDDISTLFKIANTLHKLRRQNGALAIYDIKKGIFTNEEGQIQRLSADKANRGYILIQELMIMANKAVAMHLAGQDVPILFRNHTVRQNAPDREEILAQVNQLLAGYGQVDTHNNRTALWFNRADYGPELKGHFGLNEIAYTHLTSPIRRFADMVNHYQIKAHITNSELPFSKHQLFELALSINAKTEEEREARSQHEKVRATKKANDLLGREEVNALYDISSREFTRVVLQACQLEEVPKSFRYAVQKRIGQNNIDPGNILYILFVPKRTPAQWKEIKEQILEYALEKEGYPRMVLNISTQKKFPLSEYHPITVNVASGFMCRIIGIVDGVKVSCASYSQAASKKDAVAKASSEFLKAWVQNTLVDASQVEKPENFSGLNHKIKPYRQGNWTGKLASIAASNPDLGQPEYTFEKEGPDDRPRFICTCVATVKGNDVLFTSVQKSKARAKNMAALACLEWLQQEHPLFTEVKKEKKLVKDGKSPLAILYELCHNKQWFRPIFSFSEEIVEGKQIFLGTMKMRIKEEDFENQAMAPSKKEAKQIMAKSCLRFLKENDPALEI
ncbi:MAG: RNB domain-containing ribonuclease [Bacteroidales bacterium]|nr:RNB domain-containing ribonuclease [Bacteroidales bacterium]MCF8456743.1 RNB domain-containing ribonuclease [Bacteroidales bacterium]